MLSLVDAIKFKWDRERLAIKEEEMNCAAYLERLTNDYLIKDNIKDVSDDCKCLFDIYKDKLLKIDSVEVFLDQLGLLVDVEAEFGSVYQFVASHF